MDSYEIIAAPIETLSSVVAIVSRDHDLGFCPTQQLDRHRSLWVYSVRPSDNPSRYDISRLIRTTDAVEVDVQMWTCRSFCLWHRDTD